MEQLNHVLIGVNGIAFGLLSIVAVRRLRRRNSTTVGPQPSMDEWFWLAIAVVLALISLK